MTEHVVFTDKITYDVMRSGKRNFWVEKADEPFKNGDGLNVHCMRKADQYGDPILCFTIVSGWDLGIAPGWKIYGLVPGITIPKGTTVEKPAEEKQRIPVRDNIHFDILKDFINDVKNELAKKPEGGYAESLHKTSAYQTAIEMIELMVGVAGHYEETPRESDDDQKKEDDYHNTVFLREKAMLCLQALDEVDKMMVQASVKGTEPAYGRLMTAIGILDSAVKMTANE